MRGKGDADGVTVFACRITPAYAGKRKTARPFPGAAWDHPRLCGEKISPPRGSLAFLGSPPPMRGKATIVIFFLPHFRITPAYAGKRWIFSQSLPYIQDHPRLCGEKRIAGSQLLTDTGSPPPMRGKVPAMGYFVRKIRITPAYAGKSGLRPKVERNDGDHPRLCGEKGIVKACNIVRIGSPPPMRGKD